MSTPINGGPAFPHACEDYVNGQRVGGSVFAGMSLRDYFAAKAAASLIVADANERFHLATIRGCEEREITLPEYYAGMAYEFADALLARRAKGAE